MATWIAELPVQIYYGREVMGFAQDDAGVGVELSGDGSLRAQYLVGCDGGRSVIRRTAGIEFPGWDPTRSNLIAEVEVTEETTAGNSSRRNGSSRPPPDGGWPDGAGHRDRAAARAEQRTHLARSERDAHRDLRHRLRDPQSHVDLQVHRHGASGSGIPRGVSSSQAIPHTCTTRRADKDSVLECRMR